MFHAVEFVLNSWVGLFIIGVSLTTIPVLGIMAVHRKKDNRV